MEGLNLTSADLPLAIGVIGTLTLLFYALGNKSKRKINQRIQGFRAKKHLAGTSSGIGIATNGGNALSLRRKSGEGGNPVLRAAAVVLPSPGSLQAKLARAGKTIPANQYLLICTGIMLGTISIMGLLGKSILFGVFLGIVLGFGIPNKYLKMAGNKRTKRFVLLFPDAIDLIVRGLRAGLPAGESMNMVAREIGEPVSSLFTEVMDSVRLGVTLEKALTDAAKKLQSTEFNFFTTSIILQRETGGNLGEILNNLSEVLRQRTMMRLKIKAMSSEARASAYIVGALPFAVLAALLLLSPDYIDPLFNDVRGNIAALAAASSMCTGMFIMFRMSQFEI